MESICVAVRFIESLLIDGDSKGAVSKQITFAIFMVSSLRFVIDIIGITLILTGVQVFNRAPKIRISIFR